ncbi:MAG TPA: hypothetical protein VK742_20835, partial [Candidatus Sulfotelmatobacter sp.]|nr:hypothetical protein [Candidatus Sulfotelmatobacter sp.]
ALVSTQVRNGPFSGTFCGTLDFANARFLAKNRAVVEYPATCVDTNARWEREKRSQLQKKPSGWIGACRVR